MQCSRYLPSLISYEALICRMTTLKRFQTTEICPIATNLVQIIIVISDYITGKKAKTICRNFQSISKIACKSHASFVKALSLTFCPKSQLEMLTQCPHESHLLLGLADH